MSKKVPKSITEKCFEYILPVLVNEIKKFIDQKNKIKNNIISLKKKLKVFSIIEILTIIVLLISLVISSSITMYVSISLAIFFFLTISFTLFKSNKLNKSLEQMKFKWTDNKVNKIGLSRVNFVLYPVKGGSILVDEDTILNKEVLELTELSNINDALNLKEELENNAKDLPYLYSNMENSEEISYEDEEVKERALEIVDQQSSNKTVRLFNEERKLRDVYKNIKNVYEDIDVSKVEIGLLDANENKYKKVIENIINQNDDEIKETKKEVKEIPSIYEKVNEEQDIDSHSKNLIDKLKNFSSKLSSIRSDSINILLEDNGALTSVMKAGSHNFYCPVCNNDIIEDLLNRNYDIKSGNNYEPVSFIRKSKLILTDWKKGEWYCKLCDNKTKNPIPVHKMFDEVFMKSGNYLFEENEKERIKIYGELRNRLIQFNQEMEKEQQLVSRDSRKIISGEKTKIYELNAIIKTKQELIVKLTELMDKNRYMLDSEIKNINNYVEEVTSKLLEKNLIAIKSIDNEVYELNTDMKEKSEELIEYARKDQEVRDNVQKSIVEYVKKTADLNEENISKLDNLYKYVEESSEESKKTSKEMIEIVKDTASAVKKTEKSSKEIIKIAKDTANVVKKTEKSSKEIIDVTKTASQEASKAAKASENALKKINKD